MASGGAGTIRDPGAPVLPRAGDGPAPAAAAPGVRPLPPAIAAAPRRRRWLQPATGWFRRIERGVNQFLSRRVYPRIPGLHHIYGVQLRRQLTVLEGEIPIDRLPAACDGLTILLVTDIHSGAFLGPAALGGAFARLLALAPDLILLGGDLTTTGVGEFDACADAFRSLRAPLGVYAVLGNHDHYTGDPAGLRRRLEAAGIAVLHNSALTLRRGAGRVVLAGIDDLIAGRPDLEAALQAAHREAAAVDTRAADAIAGSGAADGGPAPILLLSHNPDVFFDAARRGVALVLSGHTHGGQIRVPGLPVLVRMSRYHLDEGRYAVGGAQLVVSRGLGATGLPLRIACPPEAVLVKLRTAC